MHKPCSRNDANYAQRRDERDKRNARLCLLSSLSRYLHEPASTVARLLDRNRNYLKEIDQLRNHPQRHSRLDHHLASFQLQQSEALEQVLLHNPGSRILASFHFGDFIYGNSIVAGHEEPERQQYYLTQLPATEAFLANISYCFGEQELQRRKQLLTNATSPLSLVSRLRGEQCTLLTFVDLPAGFGERVRVRFLGREASFPKGPAVLSLASRAPLLPVLNYRTGFSNTIQLFPMLEPRRSKGESFSQACARLTQQLVNVLEDAVLKNPWQWRFLPSLPAYFDNNFK